MTLFDLLDPIFDPFWEQDDHVDDDGRTLADLLGADGIRGRPVLAEESESGR